MIYELQSLLHGTDISLYKPLEDYSEENNDRDYQDFLQISADDVVALSLDEDETQTPLDATILTVKNKPKEHNFSTKDLDDVDMRPLENVKLAEQVVDIWDCEDVQAALNDGKCRVGVYIDHDLETIFSEFEESVQKYQSLPISTYVPVSLTGDDTILSDSSIGFVCAEITFSVTGTTIRLLDRDMADGYWYLTEPMPFEL